MATRPPFDAFGPERGIRSHWMDLIRRHLIWLALAIYTTESILYNRRSRQVAKAGTVAT